MTNRTTEHCEISGVGMAIAALVPFPFVFPAVNREIHAVVIKGSWRPGGFTMTIVASGRESGRCVIWALGLIIIGLMAAGTILWRRRAVISVQMAGIASCGGMRSLQRKNIVMIKSGRYPRRFAVAGLTIR